METKHKIKDRENGCPFGHKCDQCNLYTPLYHTAVGGAITAEYDCQFNNLAVISDELKNRMTGVQGAVESRMNSLLAFASESQRRRLEDKGPLNGN